ncbi:MAG: TIGR01244 family phosphatase [Sphingomonadales bacterium]|nr:TIGR01244 family phosphatase [Sphingomonadales bacterium]MDE2172013.1 TIGR01244 family phosphatase [Sphingomonadales bacterium]
MKPVALAQGLHASPQLSLSDVEEARRLGYRAIIVNRPDGEEAGQPTIASMRQAVTDAGLGFAAIPIAPGQASGPDIALFKQALDALPKPILAYCRTGTRAATLWALSQARAFDPDDLIGAAAAAGYDLSPLRPEIARRHASSNAS